MNKVEELIEGHCFVTNPNWICGVGDNEEVKLGIYIEVMDWFEATGERENAPWCFSMSILPVECHPSISKNDDDKFTGEFSHIYDVNSYMGGVPVDHKFLEMDAINEKLMGDLKTKDAVLVTTEHTHGTIAAQKGPGAEFTHPMFTNEEACTAFATALINRYASVIMGLIGFTLDQPINMVGDDGWSSIESALKGI